MMARRKMSLTELSEKVGITMANLSILKKGKAKAIRFSTMEAICEILDCQPGDILEFVPDDEGKYNRHGQGLGVLTKHGFAARLDGCRLGH